MTVKTEFKIKIPAFEGPLDLLLYCIEKRKLLINDISLAKVTDDYISYVRGHEQFPIVDSANFILIASTLLLIKSKSLLPELNLSEEEKGTIEDLERRLKIYRQIKELSIHIKERFGVSLIFARSEFKNITPVFTPLQTITKNAVRQSIKEVLKNFPKKEKIPTALVRQTISFEAMILNLMERIKTNFRMSFHDFSKYGKSEKLHVIVSFLAMLELVRQGVITVNQEKSGADIYMETEEVGVPKYGQ